MEELGLIRSIVSVANNHTTLECFKLMECENISGVPIVDAAGRAVASLSAADIRV